MKEHVTTGRTALVDVLRVRHRVCSCMGDSMLGKPIKCHKCLPGTLSSDVRELVAQGCIVGCGHIHLYSKGYLRRMALLKEINRLGEEVALKILENEEKL